MSEVKQTPGELKTLYILHRAMLMGLVIFSAIAGWLVYSGTFPGDMKNEEKIFQVITIILSAGGFYVGTLVFKKRLTEIKEGNLNFNEKMTIYRSACIVQWALLEGPALFSVISFLLTSNYAFLMLAIVLMLVFALLAPSKIKMIFQMQLSQEEADKL